MNNRKWTFKRFVECINQTRRLPGVLNGLSLPVFSKVTFGGPGTTSGIPVHGNLAICPWKTVRLCNIAIWLLISALSKKFLKCAVFKRYLGGSFFKLCDPSTSELHWGRDQTRINMLSIRNAYTSYYGRALVVAFSMMSSTLDPQTITKVRQIMMPLFCEKLTNQWPVLGETWKWLEIHYLTLNMPILFKLAYFTIQKVVTSLKY